jgi:hypothetical protein
MIETAKSEITTGAPATDLAAGTIVDAVEIGRQIGVSFQKAANEVMATAALCVAAYERHSTTSLSTVLRTARMGKATFLKLVRIGRDERLAPIMLRLPPSYSIMYEVSQLDDRQLGEALAAELIRPDMRRAEIVCLRKPSNGKGGRAGKANEKSLDGGSATRVKASETTNALISASAGRRFELRVPSSASDQDSRHIEKMMERLHADFPVEIVPIE